MGFGFFALDNVLGQLRYLKSRLVVELPLFCQGVRELLHFDIVERLLEDEQAVGFADFGPHFLPRIISVGGADDDLEFRIHFPDARDGFNAIPTGRHPHVHEGHAVRPVVPERLLHHLQRLLALIGGVQLKTHLIRRRLVVIEEHPFHFFHSGLIGVVRAENLPEVVVDARIVVNDQDAIVWFKVCAFHVFLWVAGSFSCWADVAVGNSRVNSAPLPGPSLWAVRVPPISFAALAPLWRPKPWPSFLVVKPWLKIRVRFSGSIPTPLSAMVIFTSPGNP